MYEKWDYTIEDLTTVLPRLAKCYTQVTPIDSAVYVYIVPCLSSGLLGDWVLKLFPILISFISKIIQSSIFPSSCCGSILDGN